MPRFIAIIVIFFFLHSISTAEQIVSISDNSFETEEITVILTPEMYAGTTDFIFNSSPALRGRVEISAIEGENIEIIYHKVLYADSREQAESFAEIISLRNERSGNSFVLVADAPRDAPWRRSANLSGQIECEVYLPQKFAITTDVIGYYLNIKGPFPEVDIKGNYCEEILVSKIELGLKIDVKNSMVTLRDINGPSLIKNEGGNISARDVNAGLGIASFENIRGAVTVEGFIGDELRCEVEEGNINLEKVSLENNANAYIYNSGINSDIYVDLETMSNSRLEIVNRSADVLLILPRDIASEFEINADPDDGEIEVEGVPLITDEIDYGKLLARTTNPNSEIIIDTRGTGKVTLKRREF